MTYCPTTGKRIYATQEHAADAARDLAEEYGGEFEPYLGRTCQHHHVRSKTKRAGKMIERLRRRNADPAVKAAKRKRYRENRRRRDQGDT